MVTWAFVFALYVLGALNMALLVQNIGHLWRWRSLAVIAFWPPVALAATAQEVWIAIPDSIKLKKGNDFCEG